MNPWIEKFAQRHKQKIQGNVLEVGSFNVNGTVRDIFPITIGTDMREGEGVDEVVNATQLVARFGLESFDCVVSCDMLEHAEDWRGCLSSMWQVLKKDGFLFLTMANMKKGRHGYPNDYWRFDFDTYLSLFRDNEIIDSFLGGPSQGVLVRKTAYLDLTPEPDKV